MNPLRALAALAVAWSVSASASAALMQFNFAGTLDVVPTELAGTFSVGQAFTVSYIFDTNAPVVGGAVTSGAGYADYDATSLAAAVGSWSASAANASIRVNNNYTIDEFVAYPVTGSAVAAPISGFSFVGMDVRYQDFSGIALVDTSLPDDPGDLAAMPGRFVLTFFQLSNSTHYQPWGSIDSATVTAVPEPAALALLLTAAPLLLRRRRLVA